MYLCNSTKLATRHNRTRSNNKPLPSDHILSLLKTVIGVAETL